MRYNELQQAAVKIIAAVIAGTVYWGISRLTTDSNVKKLDDGRCDISMPAEVKYKT